MTPLELNSGDTAWMLTSAALVLLMTPGLALFYGGMVRAKSVLNMMMMSFGALALISVLWVLYGYSFAFGNDIGYGLLGNPAEYLGLKGLMADDPTATYPAMAFVAFQAVFAIITVALISGAIADRAKFGTWLIFSGIWASVVYFPVAHWVFDFTLTDDNDVVTHVGGWIANNLKAIDFAGGTAVHINAGAAGLALALVLGRRIGWKKDPMRPHNLTLVMLGRRSAVVRLVRLQRRLGASRRATPPSVAFVNTMVATGAATLGWLLTERIRDGHATSLGAASGVVAGLVAITPACSSVSPIGAIILGAVAGVLCALAVGLKYKFGYDDSLDVVGVHLVGGLWGTLAVGFLATEAAPAGRQRSLLRRRCRPAVAAGRRCVRRADRLSFVLTLRDRLPAAEDHRLPGQPRTTSSRASTTPSTRRPATISTPLGSIGRGATFGGSHRTDEDEARQLMTRR